MKVQQERLLDSIHTSCAWGAAHSYGPGSTQTGMARLSLNDSDALARQWFVQETTKLGCSVTVDQMGNIFAIRTGKNMSLAPVYMGSHLDTQPIGGRYDGILGVTAGLEVLRVLVDHSIETEGPIGVVNWTNEEGARFPMMAVASGVWAGEVPLDTAWALKEIAGEKKSMKEELERIGFLGDIKCSFENMPMAAHFELHIEQGPILESERQKIGVVKSVQAFKWFEIKVSGKGTHTGTTPFYARRDALLCAARLIIESNTVAKNLSGLASTGILNITPGSTNTIPDSVIFTLDIRHVSNDTLQEIETACKQAFSRIAESESEKGCSVEWKTLVDSPAVFFNASCISSVEASAKDACKEGEWRAMVSGAGHDSCYTSKRCPTSMIFVPSKEGVSHHRGIYKS